MKRQAMFAGVLLLLALPACAGAQQDEAMPGMSMPKQQGEPHASESPKQAVPEMPVPQPQQHELMPGMHMPGDAAPPRAPASTSTQSTMQDTQHLQEPENPDFHTGTETPAPLLLGEISKRTPIPLQFFLDAAEKGNPTLAEAGALVRRSTEQARQAGLYPNPSAGYQGEQIRGGGYGGGEQGGFVQQSIVLGGKLGARRGIYTQQAASDRIGVEEQRARVRDDVMQAFYTTLFSQAIVVERQNLLHLAEEAVTTAHQLANVGQADAPDVLQAEVEAEQAKVDFVAAQREFLGEFSLLAAVSNQTELPVSPLAGELDKAPVLDAEQQVTVIVAGSPAIRRTQQELAVAEARLNDARREAVPDVLLRAGEQYNGETIALDPRKSVGAQSFAEAGVTLPLWNRNQGNIEAAKAEVERARQEVVRAQLTLRQQAESLAQEYESSRFQADRYRNELIPRAKRAYELYLTKYQQMAQAYPQVIVSQRTLFQVQIGYLQSLLSVWSAAAALENNTVHGGLDAPLASGSSSTTLNLPNGGAGAE